MNSSSSVIGSGSLDNEYSFRESFNIVKSVFEKLDPEFSNILEKYISQGRYDVHPQKGKQGGAFCISVGSKYPTYILLNHNNKLEDVSVKKLTKKNPTMAEKFANLNKDSK